MPSSDLPVLALPFAAAPLPGTAPAAHPHLIIPYAALADARCQQALTTLQRPQLQRLLQALTLSHVNEGREDDPIPPHERAVARAAGLDPTAPAWAAAAHSAQATQPSAWLTPCHWTAGADQVRMDDPAALGLTDADALALHAIMAPWLAQDGLVLTIVNPQLWRLQGAPLQGLLTASLDRVLLRDVRPWLPAAAPARHLQRLHSEVQMLLYTHPFNDDRTARGLLPVNAFWLHGAGSLPASAPVAAVPPATTVLDDLRQAALRQHWQAWAAAWQAADAGPIAALAQHVAAGGAATLTLCGEHHARTYTTAPRSWLQKMQAVFRRTSLKDLDTAL